eukprot:1647145-Rhodomonas_salina.1
MSGTDIAYGVRACYAVPGTDGGICLCDPVYSARKWCYWPTRSLCDVRNADSVATLTYRPTCWLCDVQYCDRLCQASPGARYAMCGTKLGCAAMVYKYSDRLGSAIRGYDAITRYAMCGTETGCTAARLWAISES